LTKTSCSGAARLSGEFPPWAGKRPSLQRAFLKIKEKKKKRKESHLAWSSCYDAEYLTSAPHEGMKIPGTACLKGASIHSSSKYSISHHTKTGMFCPY
jgi:hypothetical protein